MYAGAVAGIGSSIAGLAGGSNQPQIAGAGGGSPYFYQPTGQPQADLSYQSLLDNMINNPQYGAQTLPFTTLGQQQGVVSSLMNNPYASPYISGAAAAGQAASGQVAPMQFGGASSLYAGAFPALQGGQQIMQQGFDPQSALYNQQQNNLSQQMNAANAAAGLSGPAAAGVSQQGLTNFNIDWQNNLLGRENTALQGYGTAMNAAGQAFTGASNLGQGGVASLLAGAQDPYSAYQSVYGNQLSALSGLQTATGAAWSPTQNALSDLQSYLQLGQADATAALAGQNTGFNQNTQLGTNLGSTLMNPSLVSGVQSLFGNGSPYSQSPYSQYNSLYGTSYNSSANDNYGYPGFDFSQAA